MNPDTSRNSETCVPCRAVSVRVRVYVCLSPRRRGPAIAGVAIGRLHGMLYVACRTLPRCIVRPEQVAHTALPYRLKVLHVRGGKPRPVFLTDQALEHHRREKAAVRQVVLLWKDTLSCIRRGMLRRT